MVKRSVLLTGFMATGKSRVGRLVAERVGVTLFDLDAEIERQTGTSIPDLFSQQGEAGFRQIERRLLEEALSRSAAPRVFALGGGALLPRDLRLRVLDEGVVVTLQASVAESLRRARAEENQRPLLQGRDERQMASLLEARQDAYAESHARIETEGSTPEQVAEQVLQVWRGDPLCVAAAERSYPVYIGAGIAGDLIARASSTATVRVLVSDRHVAPLHASGLLAQLALPALLATMPAGEEHKQLDTLKEVWKAASDNGADRRSVFIGLGGGVVTDMTGFASASWLRGVSWIAAPTTLLAMVDAAIGGKTGVDFGMAKNALGAFWQPGLVVCDTNYLATEPTRGYVSALSEVIKTAIVGDPELLSFVEQQASALLAREQAVAEHVVRRCARVKARVVSSDQREAGMRAALNLGHTVGHALEAWGGYGRLAHGEAISLGLVAALRLGVRYRVTDPALAERVTALLARLGLPVDLSREPLGEAVELIGLDKKRSGGSVKFVFAAAAGGVCFQPIEIGELQRLVCEL